MFFDELQVGMTVDTEPAVIEKDKMMAFAHDYDNIPLHTDEEYAKKTPFGKLIAPGVMSFMSVWAKYLEIDLAGEELIAGKSTKIEWIKPVFAEDVLTSTCTVSNLTKRNTKNGKNLVSIVASAHSPMVTISCQIVMTYHLPSQSVSEIPSGNTKYKSWQESKTTPHQTKAGNRQMPVLRLMPYNAFFPSSTAP